jgi:hypothetical protein
MSKRSDAEECKLTEQVAKAKPGFIPVRQVRGAPTQPAAPVNSGTPDTPVLRAKPDRFRDRTESSDAGSSTDALRKKFLPGGDAGNPGPDSPKRGGRRAKRSSPEVKGNPRIVSVRPTRGADTDEGVPPKDLQLVMDDEGQIGESS